MTNQHTPEPWAYAYGAVYQSDPQGSDSGLGPRIALADRECPETTPAERDANLRRAAACVNACRGIPTAALEARAVAALIALAESIASMDPEQWDSDPSTASLRDWTISTIEAARVDLARLGVTAPTA